MRASSDSGSGPLLQTFRFDRLRPAQSEEEFNVHRAALEWSLDAPIAIHSEKDILSKRVWSERFDPYAHQIRNLITFCRRAPVALLADDVGLGKTISAGLILSELMVRRRVTRTLIVAPKLLLPQWEEELATKFGIPSSPASGAELKTAFRRQIPVVITTYHSLRRHLHLLKDSSFDMLILDEAHKLRNLYGTSKPPQFALGVREALRDRVFKYVLMLTATPIQNRLWDLYSLIDLLTIAKGHANPLGDPKWFKKAYVDDHRAVRVHADMRGAFRRHLSNYIVRTRRTDAKLVFPTRQVQTYLVEAKEQERRLMSVVGDLFSDPCVKLNGLAQSSIGQALMSSPRALVSQARRMEQRGTLPGRIVRDLEDASGAMNRSGKSDGLLDLVDELAARRPEDWRAVVFTSRTQTQEMIGNLLTERGVSVGYIRGGRAHDNERALRLFRDSPPGFRVLVSTDAGAEGVNLQVANVLVNFDLPWNPMVLEQRIGRVQRLSSIHAEVIILNLVLADSVEEKVVARLGEKLQAISESMGDVEGILESASMDDGEGESFEAMVRRLVVDSLRGIDVEASTASALKSIEDAKQMFEAEKDTVERTLGNLRDLHSAGPRVPEIEPVQPSIDARNFVLRALRAEGGRVHPIDSKVLEVALPGQHPFRLAFDERSITEAEATGVFGRTTPRLFIPGKRDFERLSQSWSEKCAAFVIDRTTPHEDMLQMALESAQPMADRWELTDFSVADRTIRFDGELWCRTTIANEVDRLEKLIRVRVGDPSASAVPVESDPLSRDAVSRDDIPGDLERLVAEAVTTETDLNKFHVFYCERLKEELPRAGDAASRLRLERQFTPTIAADAVGITGIRSATIAVEASVRIEGHGPFVVRYEVQYDPEGTLRAECRDPLVKCERSGLTLPPTATATCACTGKQVAVWLVERCAESGRLALADELVVCAESGDRVIPCETSVCSATGVRVKRSLLSESEVSGTLALNKMFQKCEFTGATILVDEALISEISGRAYRRDERTVSALTANSGHASEFVESVEPAGPIERELAAQSDVSGSWAAKRLLVESSITPDRWGLPSETMVCAISGRTILSDEAGLSEVSGKPADPSLLAKCEFTGALVLPDELVRSEISGRNFREDRVVRSAVSGRAGYPTEFVRGVLPMGWIAEDEATRSDVGGDWASSNELVASEREPYRRGLPSEIVTCEHSGRRLLRDEVRLSLISGKTVDDSLLVASAASGRVALPEEMVVCGKSGDRFCPDEVAKCSISGQLVDERLLATSSLSDRRGLKDLMLMCSETGRTLLPDECVRCELTGKMAGSDATAKCAITGRLAVRSKLITATQSGTVYIDDNATRDRVYELTGLRSITSRCDWSGAEVLTVDTDVCRITGLRVGKQHLNDSKEIRTVRSLLNGETIESSKPFDAQQIAWLRAASSRLSTAQDAEGIKTGDRRHAMVCVRCKGGLLSLGALYAFVMIERTSPPRLIMEPILGKRRANGWYMISD